MDSSLRWFVHPFDQWPVPKKSVKKVFSLETRNSLGFLNTVSTHHAPWISQTRLRCLKKQNLNSYFAFLYRNYYFYLKLILIALNLDSLSLSMLFTRKQTHIFRSSKPHILTHSFSNVFSVVFSVPNESSPNDARTLSNWGFSSVAFTCNKIFVEVVIRSTSPTPFFLSFSRCAIYTHNTDNSIAYLQCTFLFQCKESQWMMLLQKLRKTT